jgi:hypothetical protein
MKPMSYMTVREALAKIMRYEKENWNGEETKDRTKISNNRGF